MERPKTQYARLGDDRIAYQVMGEGPLDIVFTTGSFSNVDARWNHPDSAYILERLAGFSRLIVFDPRNSGASDDLPPDEPFGWESWVADMNAVLDAVGSERTAVFTLADACPAAMLFAATEPERITALVLSGAVARYTRAPDYPFGFHQDMVAALTHQVGEMWGTQELAKLMYPSRAGDTRFLEWLTAEMRAGSSPRKIEQLFARMYQLDVRQALPLINVPTLILATENEVFFDHVQYAAERIKGSRVEWFPTKDGTPMFEYTDRVLDIVEEFLTGVRRAVEPQRKLATVVFTDIVGSTDKAAALGDGRWRRLLDEHDNIVRDRVTRLGGNLVKTTGDGALATFEGPAKSIRSTIAMREALGAIDVPIRAGVHCGEIELRGDDVGGIAVHIAARVMGEAGPGEILASSTVKDLVVGSGIAFTDRGVRALKGIPDEWRLFAVESV